jgi:hypothetical protein
MSFFNLAEWAYWEQNEPFPAWKTMNCRKYSFSKLTQFAQGTQVVDVGASIIGAFLWRDACVFSSQLNWSIWGKQSLSPT